MFLACFIFLVVLFMLWDHSGPSLWNGVSPSWAFTITFNLIMKNLFEAYTQPTLLSRLSFPETLSTQVTIGCIKLTIKLNTAASVPVILDNFLVENGSWPSNFSQFLFVRGETGLIWISLEYCASQNDSEWLQSVTEVSSPRTKVVLWSDRL